MSETLDHSSEVAGMKLYHFEEVLFLKAFKSDLGKILDDLELNHSMKIPSSLRMGTIGSKNDFLLPAIKPYTVDEVLEEKLIAKLKVIKYISKVFIDEQKHLVMDLNKSVVFSCILNQVSQTKHKYGAIKPSLFHSCLVLVHNSHVKTLNTLKLTLLSEHLVSFLLFNGISVFVSGLERLPSLTSNSSCISCSEQCCQGIDLLTELVFKESKKCIHRKKLNCQDDVIIIDGGSIVAKYPLKVGLIKITDTKSKIIKNCAYMLHFDHDHNIRQNVIVHVCANSDFDKVVLSGCLNEILGLSHSLDYFISSQGISPKDSNEISVESYIEFSKKEISKAILDCNSSDLLLNEMLDSLLDTSLKFTFLAGRTNSSMNLNISNCEALKRNDGIFVQYNFARLSKLLETFDLKVLNGTYKKLPELGDIDFNLLHEKEEWDLLKFIMFYPGIIEEVYDSIFSKNGFLSNKIFLMLKNLSHLFSKYYRRVRVLTGPEVQLQKVMFARIWLLKGIHQVFSNSFEIINVKGLKCM